MAHRSGCKCKPPVLRAVPAHFATPDRGIRRSVDTSVLRRQSSLHRKGSCAFAHQADVALDVVRSWIVRTYQVGVAFVEPDGPHFFRGRSGRAASPLAAGIPFTIHFRFSNSGGLVAPALPTPTEQSVIPEATKRLCQAPCLP